MKPPIWFTEFVNKQFIPEMSGIKFRLGNIENDIVTIKQDIKYINARIDNLVIKNNLNE